MNADDRVVAEKRLDQNVEGTNEGNVYIPDEDLKSAFEIDINKLKLRKWEMTGDESDYFNYGMNESMWKVKRAKSLASRIMPSSSIADVER